MGWSESILDNLNPPQREAASHSGGAQLILAGAGSGKTRTIVHRIAYLIHEQQVPPWKIVGVTFTNKAAAEMVERTLALAGPIASECLIRTYHSLGLFMLRRYSQYLEYPSNFTVWDDTDQQGSIQLILGAHFKEKFNKTQVRYIANTISSFKDQLVGPDDLDEHIDLEQYEFGEILPEVYALYETAKRNSFAMDFADLIYQTVKVFNEYPEALERVHSRYQYFLVDEYQDTNHGQYTLIQLLAKASGNLCVVGDDDQAIYGWRGADVSNILEFSKDFPDAQVTKLEENYRSTQPILDVANSIIEHNSERMEKSLWTARKEGGKPRLLNLSSDIKEAEAIANIIDGLRHQMSPHEIAILYRTNAQSRILEEAMLNLKIPYRVYGGVSFFARKEVKDFLAYLRFVANPNDEVAFLRLVNTPSRGIGEKTVQKLYDYRAQTNPSGDFLQIISDADALPVSTKAKNSLVGLHELLSDFRTRVEKAIDFGLLFEDLLERSGLRRMYEEEDRLLGTSRMENLAELKNSMLNYQETKEDVSVVDYIQEISLYTSSEDRGDSEKCVNLMTVHNAKGLEFEVVFVAGLDDDIFPHYLSKRDLTIDEERRLLYVATTRAKDQLYLTRASRRFSQGFSQSTNPSPFLGEIPPDMIESQSERPGSGGSYTSYRRPPARRPASQPASSKSSGFSNVISSKPAAAPSGSKYKPGDSVRHPSFGVGKVMRLEGSGDATKIHIFFEDRKTRKFLLAYTNLEEA